VLVSRLAPIVPIAPIVLFASVSVSMLSAGCGGALDDISVKSASIDDVNWAGMAVVVGFSSTQGTLTIVDDGDQPHAFPVTIGGPDLGIIFDVGVGDDNPDDCLMQNSAGLELPAGKKLVGSDVTGSYLGSKESAHLAIGGESHDLSNGSGVKLSGGAINIGIGMLVAFEWLNIGIDDEN